MKHTTVIVSVALALAAALSVQPANALSARTFVSGHGSDTNPCNLAGPCRTFAAAYALTAPGGEIAVLDTAGYGPLTITHALSIVNPGAFEAGIVVPSGGAGITVNAGASDAVSLRGLTIDGQGVGSYGIQFNTGASLTVENSAIRHVFGIGINFAPNATSRLSVSNSLVTDNSYIGIQVSPSGSGAVSAVLNHVQANNNSYYGVFVDGEFSTGTVKATVYDSIAAGNDSTGFLSFSASGHAPTTLMLFHSVAANNGIGLDSNGGATLRVAHSMVTGNATGWFSPGGFFSSAGDNTIEGNTAGETAPPTYALK
jgi:hypothetical protein